MSTPSNKIVYNRGQLVGECEFIKELPSIKRGDGKGYNRAAKFKCLFCGSYFNAYVNNVKRKYTQSCGCHQKETMKRIMTTHGLTGNQVFDVYRNIISRCYNPHSSSYKNYGGRGISVYSKWVNNPSAFVEYVIKLPNYGKPGRSLDRIDNDGNYEPGNIRWATKREQGANRRKNKNNTSGYTGVLYRKSRNKYISYIGINRKTIWVTHSAKSAKEAAIARDQYIIDNKLWEYPLQILTNEKEKKQRQDSYQI